MNVGYGIRNTVIGHQAMLGASAAAGAITSCGYAQTTTTVTCSSNATVNVNQRVTGTDIAEGTYVTAITGGYGSVTSFVISQATTNASGGTLAGQTLTFYQTNADDCVAIGANALLAVTTGGKNIAIGSYALDAATTGSANVCIGHNAGTAMTSNVSNIAIGKDTLAAANDSEHYNIAIGDGALGAETSGADGQSNHRHRQRVYGLSSRWCWGDYWS